MILAAAVGLAVFVLASVAARRRRAARLERLVLPHLVAPELELPRDPLRTGAESRVARALESLEQSLARHRYWHAFALRVERAGIERRPIDVAAAVGGMSLLLAVLGGAAGSPAVAVLGAVGPAALSFSGLGVLAQRRLRAFDEQLPDLLSGLAASLRAGHGFLQSLQAVASDAPDPAGGELRRALAEARLGRPVEDALADVGRRVPSRDFVYVLTAIAVQREVGGSLAGLFETVNETVRQRQQFARKVRALTATGRTSAYTLVALPIGVGLFLTTVNHGYLTPMFENHWGRLLLLGSAVSMVIGAFIVRRIVSFEA